MTKRSIRVVLVEDVEAHAELAVEVLDRAGFALQSTRVDDPDALRAALVPPPDIILCDQSLPGFSAEQALTLLRDEAPEVPVVLLTGAVGDEAAAAAIKAGATDFLLKRNIDRLPRVVERALEEVDLREAVRKSERSFHNLVQTVKAVVWRADARQRRLTFVSSEAEELFGYPVDAWTADPRFWEEHVHEEDREAAKQRTRAALAGGTSYGAEYRMIAADGRIVWVRDVVEVISDSGQVTELVGLMVDVTELKTAEQEAATRADQQAAVVALGQLAVRGFSLQMLFDESVEAVANTLGVTRAAVVTAAYPEPAIMCVSGDGDVVVGWGLGSSRDSVERYTTGSDEPVLSIDVPEDPRFSRAVFEGTVSAMCVPIRDEEGLFGVLGAYSDAKREFTDNDVNFLQAVANVLSSAIRRERSQKQIALQARVLDQVGALVCVVDRTGRITYSNEAATAVGWNAEDLLGRKFQETLLSEADRDEARLLLGSVEPGDRRSTEWRIRNTDGDTIPHHVTVSAAPDDHGASSRIIVVGVDMSQRIEMEKRLRASEEQFRTAFMNMPAGMMVCDCDGRYIAVNDAFCRMLGYERDELLGLTFEDITHPDDLEASKAMVSQILNDAGTVELDKRYVRKDGSTVWAHVTDIALARGIGDAYVIVHVLDITEAKRAEDERRKLERQLLESQKMEAIGRLAGGIAHDFNNLISVIINYAALLDEDLPDKDPAKADLKEIQGAGHRAAALVRQLLTFARREAGEMMPVDLNDVVHGLARLLDRSIGDGTTLVVELGEAVGLVRTDISHLEQILMNLIVNARDAVRGGGRILISTAEVDVDVERATALDIEPGTYGAVRVADDGEGISDDVMERIFEPFFSTKPREDGTGLGLSTVYALVKQSGGAIQVTSEVGTGTTFEVLLPRVPLPPTPEGSSSTSGTAVRASTS